MLPNGWRSCCFLVAVTLSPPSFLFADSVKAVEPVGCEDLSSDVRVVLDEA